MSKTNMNNGDYFYLAKKSVKSRKKSTKTTVRGIAFGLILILPVLYFALSFYIDFNSKINQQKTVAQFTISTLNPTYGKGDFVQDYTFLFNANVMNELPANLTPVETIYTENYALSSYDTNIKCKVNNGISKPMNEVFVKNTVNDGTNNSDTTLLSALHYDKSGGKLITDAQLNDYKKITNKTSIFTNGSDFTVGSKGAKEIIIAERIASSGKVNIGDKISLSYNGNISVNGSQMYIDNDNNPNNDFDFDNGQNSKQVNVQILDGYTIVGILANNYFDLVGNRNKPDMFITDSSLYSNINTLYAPTLKVTESMSGTYKQIRTVATYETSIEELSESAINDGKVFLGYGAGVSPYYDLFNNNINYTPSHGGMTINAQFANYSQANKVEKYLTNRAELISDNAYINLDNQLYENLKMMNMIGVIVISVLSIFGGVILFATLLNLYNSIQYSVEARRNYMGMLRAIGAKPKVIHRMYFTEIFIIFGKALIWTIIFGGGISVGIKFGFDAMFKHLSAMFPITLSLSLWYLPIVLLGIFGFTFFIGWLYSRISCRQLVEQPILSVLKEDR